MQYLCTGEVGRRRSSPIEYCETGTEWWQWDQKGTDRCKRYNKELSELEDELMGQEREGKESRINTGFGVATTGRVCVMSQKQRRQF